MSADLLNTRHWRLVSVCLLGLRQVRVHRLGFPVTVGVLILSLFWSLQTGVVPISLGQLANWIVGEGTSQTNVILGQLRLPRALLAIGVGAVLALCGAVTQTVFRNPLADPSLIGVSSGASLGACLAIVLWPTITAATPGATGVAVGAFLGALSVVTLVYAVSFAKEGGVAGSNLLLLGLAITFLVGSITGFLEFVADNQMLRRISLWRMGGLYQASYFSVLLCFSVLAAIASVCLGLSKRLDALLLGESQARALGVDVRVLKSSLFFCIASGVGIAVSLTGTIAFVGLVVPHLVRLVLGAHHGVLVPFSALLGALLLLVSDTLARTVMMPAELPVGLLTAFLGAPVLIAILRRQPSGC